LLRCRPCGSRTWECANCCRCDRLCPRPPPR
jgi:hypothetical protein